MRAKVRHTRWDGKSQFLFHSPTRAEPCPRFGETLATAGWDSTVRFWDVDTGEMRGDHLVADDGRRNGYLRMYTVCYAPAGGLIATAHLDGVVRVWQAADMTLQVQFKQPGRFLYGTMSFSPEGLWLATGSMGVYLWDPMTGQMVWSSDRHQGYYTVDFGRDSRTLLSGGSDGGCYLWDVRPPGTGLNTNPSRLLDGLVKGEGSAAYQALWALSDMPDRAVNHLAEQSPQELLADVDPAERSIAARRVVALLAQLGTPAFRLLDGWAQQEDAN